MCVHNFSSLQRCLQPVYLKPCKSILLGKAFVFLLYACLLAVLMRYLAHFLPEACPKQTVLQSCHLFYHALPSTTSIVGKFIKNSLVCKGACQPAHWHTLLTTFVFPSCSILSFPFPYCNSSLVKSAVIILAIYLSFL